jgi:hypothetical protein
MNERPPADSAASEVPPPPNGAVDDAALLVAVSASYTALLDLYDRLVVGTAADERATLSLLRADWRRRSGPVLGEARCLLAALEARVVLEPRTAPHFDTARLAAGILAAPPAERLAALEALVDRFAYCIHIVPLAQVSADVARFFRACVDVEDEHLAVIGWMRDTLPHWHA